jgi:hypothetical protein
MRNKKKKCLIKLKQNLKIKKKEEGIFIIQEFIKKI